MKKLTHEERTGRFVIFNPTYREVEVSYAKLDSAAQGRGEWILPPFGERRFNNQFAVDTILRNNANKGIVGLLFDVEDNIMIDNKNVPYVMSKIPEGLTEEDYKKQQTIYGIRRGIEALEVAKLRTMQAHAEAKAAGTSLELAGIDTAKFDEELSELKGILKDLGASGKEERVSVNVEKPEWMRAKKKGRPAQNKEQANTTEGEAA